MGEYLAWRMAHTPQNWWDAREKAFASTTAFWMLRSSCKTSLQSYSSSQAKDCGVYVEASKLFHMSQDWLDTWAEVAGLAPGSKSPGHC